MKRLILKRQFSNTYENENDYEVVINHNSGFFSICTIWLIEIIETKKLLANDKVIKYNVHNLFTWYKNSKKWRYEYLF